MKRDRRRRTTGLVLGLLAALAAPRPAAVLAEPTEISAQRQDGELVLFDAAVHGLEVIENAVPKEGALRPHTKMVRKGGKAYVEFSYTGRGGRAVSHLRYGPFPAAPAGRRYYGLKLIMDYDREDFAKVDVMVRFPDGSQVGQSPQTLGPGEDEYSFSWAYRRAKWPAAWDTLNRIELSARSGGSQDKPFKWRLRKIVLMEKTDRRHRYDLRIVRVGAPQPVAGMGKLGAGTLEVLEISRVDNRDKDRTGAFRVDCKLRGFEPGVYRAQWRLEGAGTATTPLDDIVRVDAGPETERTFAIPTGPNKGGLYAFHLTLANDRKQAGAWTAEFVNSRQHPDLLGKRLFSPRPKQLVWGRGAFAARQHATLFLPRGATARTAKTAEIFRKKYLDHSGVSLATKRFGALPPRRGIMLRVAPSAAFKGASSRLKRDGYCLNVGPDRVVITGADERGLYYGMITFFQLMKNDFKIQDPMPVPCVEILDWPDLPNRMIMATHGGAWFWSSYKERRDIDWLIDWVDRFVAQNKGTLFFLDLATVVISERRPEFGGKSKLYTLDQMRRLGEFCRDNFVDVCPAWQVGGHANWWLLGLHPELREKGWQNQADVTHPDHNKIVFDVMLDTIEALGAKYATPKGDEWWHRRKKDEEDQEVVRGLTKVERYLDFQRKCHAFLKRHGVRMLLFDDMISPYHNGQRHGNYKLIDRYPKDIIFCNWGYTQSIGWFRKHGFEVWRTPNGSGGLSVERARQINGYANIVYGTGGDEGGGLKETGGGMQSTYSLCRAADIGWNAYDYPREQTGRNVSIRNLFALRPTGQASARCTPLDLSGSFTHAFGAYLKQVRPEKYGAARAPVRIKAGVRDVAHVPTRLADPAGSSCIVLRENGESVAVPVNGRYASLLFLHTVFVNNENDKRGKPGVHRQWPYGWACARYMVHYEDGEQVVVPVRLTRDVRRMDTRSKNRGTNNNRYVYVVEDCDYDPLHLFQFEWVNPNPAKTIVKVVAEHENQLDVSLILFSITGRELWEGARAVKAGRQP